MTEQPSRRRGTTAARGAGGALALALAATGTAACSPSPAPSYRIVRLALPAGVASARVDAVHDDGRIVGHHPAPAGGDRTTTLVWDGPDDAAPEQLFPGAYSRGAVSNERGDYGATTGRGPARSTVVVDGVRSEVPGEVVRIDERGRVLLHDVDPDGSAAIWEDGTLTTLVTPAPAAWSDYPLDIAADGLVVGTSVSADWEGAAWVWRDGAAEPLAPLTTDVPRPRAMNDAGRIVGGAWAGDGWHPVRWEGGGAPVALGLLPGATDAEPTAVNEAGDVIGWSLAPGGPSEAWLWQDGELRRLATLGGESADAEAIDEDGVVVGSATTGQPFVSHAALWEGDEVIDLGTLGGRESTAVDIAGPGVVVGTAAGPDQVQQPVAWLPPGTG